MENTITMQLRGATRLSKGVTGLKDPGSEEAFTGEGSFATLSELTKPSEKLLQPD